MSNQVEDSFKILWPFQNVRTLKKMPNVFVLSNKDENSSVLLIIYFHRFGLDGKACVLRLICELAESKGLPFNGLMGRAIETLFL